MSEPVKPSEREEAFNTMFAHMESLAALYASYQGTEDAIAGKNLAAYLKEKRDEIKGRVMG